MSIFLTITFDAFSLDTGGQIGYPYDVGQTAIFLGRGNNR